MTSKTYTLNPYSVLDIKSKEEARPKFYQMLKESSQEKRSILCLAFDMICNRSRYNEINGFYTTKVKDGFYYTNIGDLNGLKKVIKKKKDKNMLNVEDDLKRTLLYLAARNGYDHIVVYLIKIGVDLNKTQNIGSTPLHGAAYYGHESTVKILIENGCNPFIKNKFGNLAESEAYNDSIKTIITNSYNNQILKLYHSLYLKEKVSNFVSIKDEISGKIICYKLICKSNYNHHQKKNYAVCWHGTKFQNLESIVINGLKPSGTKICEDKIILPVKGHIPLNTTFDGIDNWAKAVFVSPSYNYSSLPEYAEIISCNNQRWACLVEGRVKYGTFSKHRHTTKTLRKNPSQPFLEYRVAITEEDNCDILFVTSVVFISMDFLESIPDEKEESIIETYEENMLISQSYWITHI